MAWPPNGAIRIPTAINKLGNEVGHKFVGMISTSEPGEVCLIKPQTMTRIVMVMVDMIPNNEKMERMESGKKVNGVKMQNVMSFVVVSLSLNTPLNESLNKIMRDTPAPIKSIEKSNEIINFAVDPYAA